MFHRRNILLAAAAAYAGQGIAVRAAHALARAPAGHDAFGRWICSCGQPCTAPGQHPAPDVEWTSDPSAVQAIWNCATPPNLLISSGDAVSLWRLPRLAGAEGLRLFEQQRPGPWPPYLKLSSGDWIVATQPAEAGVTLQLPTDTTFLEPGVPVLAPPSRRPVEDSNLLQRVLEPTGRLRWLQSPSFPQAPLPTAEAVLDLVRQAEQDHHDLLHGARTPQQV